MAGFSSDYKCYVFNGTVRYVQVIEGRYDAVRSRFYDRDWQPQPFVRAVDNGLEVEQPENFNKMIAVAENLANDLDFVRVDLYSVGDELSLER